MKILFSILSTFLYFVLSLNIAFNVHYCSDEFESLAFFAESNTCCCSAMDETLSDVKGNCCENIQYSFLFDADEQVVKSVSIPLNTFYSVKIIEILTDSPDLNENKKLKHLFYDIPPPHKKAIYKQNCSFIFYG